MSPAQDFIKAEVVKDDVAARATIGAAHPQASLYPNHKLCAMEPDDPGFQRLFYLASRSSQEAYNAEFSKVLSGRWGPELKQTFVFLRSSWVPATTTPTEAPPTFSAAYVWTFMEERQDRMEPMFDGLFVQVTRVWRDLRTGVVSESLDSETGEVRTVTQTIVAAGTHGSAIDNTGSYTEVEGLNPQWLVKSVRKAAGIAGQAVNGKAERTIPRLMRHYWPPVLRGFFHRIIYSDPADVFSAVTGHILYPLWAAFSYNGSCEGRMTEMWTKVMPDYDGDSNWPTTGSKPYIPEPTKLLPRPVDFRGTNGFNVQAESCLHTPLNFLNDGFSFYDPPTTPMVWPGTLIADVDVRPYMGGWMTTIMELDAPSTAGTSTGLDLSATAVSATSVKLSWTPAGSGTTLDVATSPDFTRGFLLRGQAVASSGTLEYTVTGMTRGTIYWARLTRGALTSNVLQIMATPSAELSLFNGTTPVTTSLAFTDTAVAAERDITLTIQNDGVLSLGSLAATFSGTNAADFSLSTLPSEVAANGGTEEVVITFNPSASGSRTASLSLASDDPDSPLVITLSGTGTNPEINVKYSGTSYASGDTISFGSVNTGSESDYTITIENTGTGVLTVAAGVGAGDWFLKTSPAESVAAGGSTTLKVTFRPTAGGTLTGLLTITNTDLDENPYTITLSGTGVAVGEIEVQDPLGLVVEGTHAYDFGTVDAAGSNTRVKTFTIYNRGAGTLASLAASVSGTNASDFTVSALGSTSLAAGASTTFTVTYDPGSTGARTCTLAIASDDANENPTNVTLNGIGGTGPNLQVEYPATTVIADDGTLDFGAALNDSGSIERTFTIRNLGTSSLTVTGVATTGGNSADFVVSAITLPATVVSDGTTTFKVTFSPTEFGVRSCTLRVTANPSTGSKIPYDITISGTGRSADALLTYQSANVVLGQADFDDQSTTASASVMTGLVYFSAISAAGKLAVTSLTDGAVYVWNSVPVANGEAAAQRITVSSPTGVAWSGEDLLVTDSNNHRVLRYVSPYTTPANVIGQPNLSTTSAGLTAAKLYSPYGLLVTSGGKLLVADYFNNRVLIWNTVPTTNGVSANVVIGHSTFTVRTAGSAANKFNGPLAMAEAPTGELLVVDTANNRVSVFTTVPTVSNESASHVLLQTGFGVTTSGTTISSCSSPAGVAVSADGAVAVSDYNNDRVALFYDLPAASGASMHAVLGQADFVSGSEWAGGSPTAQNMRRPLGVLWDGDDLIVAGDMKRALIFKPA